MPRWAAWAGSVLRGLCNVDECLMHCAGEGVDPAVVERVRETMMACSQQCQNAMRAEGIKVLALFSQDVQSMANIKCHVQTAKWRRILDVSARPPRTLCACQCLLLIHCRLVAEIFAHQSGCINFGQAQGSGCES